MHVRDVELRRVRLPFVRPFRTATGTATVKDALLVRVRTADACGWGECAAEPTASYLTETIETARRALREHLVPSVLGASEVDAVGARERWAHLPGNETAKAALEMALLDAHLRTQDVTLATFLGGVRATVPAGVAIGITGDLDQLGTLVRSYVAAGYRRCKLKIEPGADVEVARTARTAAGAGVAIAVDANGSYTIDSAVALDPLDDLGLQCVEQPLGRDALVDHAALAQRWRTPICLDESITSAPATREAIRAGACAMVSVKLGRLGGVLAARRVHDECVAAGIPALAGGMLETGIGRAAAIALASLPGFTETGDLSASARYFAEDLTEPFVLEDGALRVPSGPGLGVTVRDDVLARVTIERELLRARDL